MNTISVLIPVYNSEKYLEECLKSVINQDYKNLEIIIINDGSADSSLEIIKHFAKNDTRIKVIDKKNTGYGDSLNHALKKSCGNYISIIESDDYIEKNFYSELIKNCTNEDIIKTSFNLIQNNKKISKYSIINKEYFLIKPSIWSGIYKKSFLEKNNIHFLNTKGASYQDTSFHFKTFYFAENVKLIDSFLYNYRIDNENSSVNNSLKVYEILEEFKEINKITNEINEPIKLLFELRAYIWNLKRIKSEFKKDFLIEISNIFSKYNLKKFYKSKKISKKEKLKIFLLANYPKLFYNLLILTGRKNGK